MESVRNIRGQILQARTCFVPVLYSLSSLGPLVAAQEVAAAYDSEQPMAQALVEATSYWRDNTIAVLASVCPILQVPLDSRGSSLWSSGYPEAQGTLRQTVVEHPPTRSYSSGICMSHRIDSQDPSSSERSAQLQDTDPTSRGSEQVQHYLLLLFASSSPWQSLPADSFLT